MATKEKEPVEERPSGVPPPHGLGESSSEMRWLILGLLVFVAIIVAFIYQSR